MQKLLWIESLVTKLGEVWPRARRRTAAVPVTAVGPWHSNGVVAAPTDALASRAAVPVTSGPVTVSRVGQCHSAAAGQLVVVVEVATTVDMEMFESDGVLITADGQKAEPLDVIVADEILAGVTYLVVFMFQTAGPVGSLELSFYDVDNAEFAVTLPIGTR